MPWRKKDVPEEQIDYLKKTLKDKGYNNVQDIIETVTNSGLVKKRFLFGIRSYKPPIVLFVRDDGKVEIKEKAQPGILTMKVDKEEVKYVLDPKKLHQFPNAFGESMRGWIIFEGDAFSQPTDPVYDATVFNNIMIQMEAQARFDELRMRGLDLKKWGMIAFASIIIIALVMANLDKIAHYIPWFKQAQPVAQNIVENATQIKGGP